MMVKTIAPARRSLDEARQNIKAHTLPIAFWMWASAVVAVFDPLAELPKLGYAALLKANDLMRSRFNARLIEAKIFFKGGNVGGVGGLRQEHRCRVSRIEQQNERDHRDHERDTDGVHQLVKDIRSHA